MRLVDVVVAVRTSLTPDLLREPYRAKVLAGADPMTGHCYVASEAAWHLLGGPSSEWRPAFVRHEGAPHWFLRNDTGWLLDLTSGQFTTIVPWHLGRGKGFLTKEPSKRTTIVIERARKLLEGVG